MTTNERILILEEEIKKIFLKENISKLDVFKANKHLETWKLLTDHKEDQTPFPKNISSIVLDGDPRWHRKNSLFSRIK
jgi:hypothetical protein